MGWGGRKREREREREGDRGSDRGREGREEVRRERQCSTLIKKNRVGRYVKLFPGFLMIL